MNINRFCQLAGCLGLLFMLPACANTADGAGKDIENMGEWVQETF